MRIFLKIEYFLKKINNKLTHFNKLFKYKLIINYQLEYSIFMLKQNTNNNE